MCQRKNIMKILQVEWHRDGGYTPNPDINKNVQFEVLDPAAQTIYPYFSNHATDVANFLVGEGSPAKDIVKKIYSLHASTYRFEGAYIGDGKRNGPPPYDKLFPQYGGDWLVENHSYGSSVLLESFALERFDQRIDMFNLVCCVAVPDANYGYDEFNGIPNPKVLYSLAKKGINVGSCDLGNQILPGGYIDICETNYTSYACPKVAAASCVIINEFLKAGKTYRYADIKDILKNGADSLGDQAQFGAGKLNLSKSLELTKKIIGSVIITPDPIPEPISIPIENAGFEAPIVGKYIKYKPSLKSSSWTFDYKAGIIGNGATFVSNNAPEGSQAAFIKGVSWFTKKLQLEVGKYKLEFKAAQRTIKQAGAQWFKVIIDGQEVNITPTNEYLDYQFLFDINLAGDKIIKFSGQNNADVMAYIDNIKLSKIS